VGEGTFHERADAGLPEYLAEDIAEGLSREELIERMEGLMTLNREAGYHWTETWGAVFYATIARSTRTFEGICALLKRGLAVQAAMLTRSLFEDVIVAHWLILKHQDRDWLAGRFLRHREAIALHQQTMEKDPALKLAMGPPMKVAEGLNKRAASLREEFGSEASRNWWDPGEEGEGKGRELGIRKIVKELEQAAAEHKMFHPRFAGGDASVLAKTERVVQKWMTQCLHHTAIGLPFLPIDEEESEVPDDPMPAVAFRAAWLYSQQVYLLQECEQRDLRPVETIWMYCMAGLVKVPEGRASEEQVEAEWDALWGEGESLEMAAWSEYFKAMPPPEDPPAEPRWKRAIRGICLEILTRLD
jgi:hypothetical protein